MREESLSLKPFDLINLLEYVFLSGRDSQKGTGQTRMEAWENFDPTENGAYLRIEAILKNFDSTRPEAAQVRVKALDWSEKDFVETDDGFKIHLGPYCVRLWKGKLGARLDYLGLPLLVDAMAGGISLKIKEAAQSHHESRILAALEPDTVTDQLSKSIAYFVSRQEPLGAEFEKVLADNIEELYETQPDTAADTTTGWRDISTESKAVEALQQLKDNATGQWVPSSVVHAIVDAALPPAPEKEGD